MTHKTSNVRNQSHDSLTEIRKKQHSEFQMFCAAAEHPSPPPLFHSKTMNKSGILIPWKTVL